MICKKCCAPGTVLLRKKDLYCDQCFITNINHKFRSCIGKNRILSSNDKVLLCLSGGRGSTVLLDMVHYGITLDNHKKLRIEPFYFHLIGSLDDEYDIKITRSLIELHKKYDFNIYFSHISEYMQENNIPLKANHIPQINKENVNKLNEMMKSMSQTAKTDFIAKVKRYLFIKYAKILECKFVFTAETTTTLAINLLSNLTVGRGSQVGNDVGFADNRNDIKILRPMRDITVEELEHYIKINKLYTVNNKEKQKKCLQSVIETFVMDLQENFPATISTVCKTADKLGIHEDNENGDSCLFCKSDLGRKKTLSALEATNFSRMVSFVRLESINTAQDILHCTEDIQEEAVHHTMFPHVYKNLCYGCSKNYNEIDCELPFHMLVQIHT